MHNVFDRWLIEVLNLASSDFVVRSDGGAECRRVQQSQAQGQADSAPPANGNGLPAHQGVDGASHYESDASGSRSGQGTPAQAPAPSLAAA